MTPITFVQSAHASLSVSWRCSVWNHIFLIRFCIKATPAKLFPGCRLDGNGCVCWASCAQWAASVWAQRSSVPGTCAAASAQPEDKYWRNVQLYQTGASQQSLEISIFPLWDCSYAAHFTKLHVLFLMRQIFLCFADTCVAAGLLQSSPWRVCHRDNTIKENDLSVFCSLFYRLKAAGSNF